MHVVSKSLQESGLISLGVLISGFLTKTFAVKLFIGESMSVVLLISWTQQKVDAYSPNKSSFRIDEVDRELVVGPYVAYHQQLFFDVFYLWI